MNDFTDVWLKSDSAMRQHLTEVAHTIDHELSVAPSRRGRPLPADPGAWFWTFFLDALHVDVVYEVFPDDRLVRVIRLAIKAA